ncbi:MAG: hypothetical protein KCHDKBKB_01051 [Elusimicrobia bacterium]|nr:hypothetical protein [Elusimicrobiota bacterium]
MSSHPLPPVPNFRVTSGEPGFVRLNWADYPVNVKVGHKLLGFRVYRSVNKDELGELIADENQLKTDVFQFDDTDPEAGPTRFYAVVGVEEAGGGESPFGEAPFGDPNTNGFSYPPFSQRPFGSSLEGYGAAFDVLGYGL